MLVFDEGKPLGDNGLRWLKMHLANVYGKDKLSFDDRIKFIDDNMAHIRKAVESPLLGIDNEVCCSADAAKIEKASMAWSRVMSAILFHQ